MSDKLLVLVRLTVVEVGKVASLCGAKVGNAVLSYNRNIIRKQLSGTASPQNEAASPTSTSRALEDQI